MDTISAKTGNAKIQKLGQTSSNVYGNNAAAGAKVQGRTGPNDLTAK